MIDENLPLFLTDKDYLSIDTLITKSGIEKKLKNNYQTLTGFAGIALKQFIVKDPLQQRTLLADFEELVAAPATLAPVSAAHTPRIAEADAAELPESLVNHYRELLRAHVIMGSGNLGAEMSLLAELLASAQIGAQQTMLLHLQVLEELIGGLGTHSATARDDAGRFAGGQGAGAFGGKLSPSGFSGSPAPSPATGAAGVRRPGGRGLTGCGRHWRGRAVGTPRVAGARHAASALQGIEP